MIWAAFWESRGSPELKAIKEEIKKFGMVLNSKDFKAAYNTHHVYMRGTSLPRNVRKSPTCVNT